MRGRLECGGIRHEEPNSNFATFRKDNIFEINVSLTFDE